MMLQHTPCPGDVFRTPSGAEVRMLPDDWIDVAMPDGATRRVSIHFDDMGNESVGFGGDDAGTARPFAEAIAAALGGRIIMDRGKIRVRLGMAPLPPMSLSESDPHDEDED